MEGMTQIYVLPSEPNTPPRALIGEIEMDTEEGKITCTGVMAVWSFDVGTWTVDGAPALPQELCDAITAHAKDLGVEWD